MQEEFTESTNVRIIIPILFDGRRGIFLRLYQGSRLPLYFVNICNLFNDIIQQLKMAAGFVIKVRSNITLV